MQETKNVSATTSVIVIGAVVVVILMVYLISSGGAPTRSQTEEPTITTSSQESASDTLSEEPTAPVDEPTSSTPAPNGEANPTIISNTLSELEQGFDGGYDDSSVDASFEDPTNELTQTYDF